MTAVYALRHPQTTWNVAERYQGRLESPVSEEGERQAERLARAFEHAGLDAIVSSPLRRARCLAAVLHRVTGAPVVFDQRLTEMAQGPWEGLHVSQIRQQFPLLHDQWYAHPDTVRFPGGENLEEVRRRAQSVLSDIFALWPRGNVAIVSHAVVIQTMAAAALGLGLDRIHRLPVANAAITTLCGTEPPGALLSLNVTAPLHHSPVASAAAQGCNRTEPRRTAS